MLKALELYGFKSFADRTRLEFPDGITVVVGPNGSGKSNVVDAIKWVLGAQSAKNLRGKEMADVIFKGSAQGRRRPANTAEATIVFDNSQGRLEVASPEVRITRRVFRSGEGEYLINDQPCRLRDIRDVLRGTGVGVDAYSIIEQGKVDSILQASPRDRRVIFEEAAGISRFKAKKVEAQRRLERVEQNLLRLSDIVEEVDNRLRRVKSQAGKARRYRQFSDRLQELRTQVGRVDWQRLTAELELLDTTVAQMGVQASECSNRIDTLERQIREIEQQLHGADEGLRHCESRLGQNREVLVGLESTMGQQRLQVQDLERQIDRYRTQIAAMQTRAGDLSSQLRQATADTEAGERRYALDGQRLEQAASDLLAVVTEIAECRDASASHRVEFEKQSLERVTLQGRIAAGRSQLEGFHATVLRLAEQRGELLARLQTQQQSLKRSRQKEAEVRNEFERHDLALSAHAQQSAQLRQQLTESQEHLTQLIRRRAAVGERASVLEEIEARAEGLSDGVQQLLELSRSQPDGVFRGVRGMVADLVLAEIDYAPLIDVALGDRAQHVVVDDRAVLDHLSGATNALAGRVGLLAVDALSEEMAAGSVPAVDLSGDAGVIGPAGDFVTARVGYEALIPWLLGRTWFVETLSDALRLGRRFARPACRFVTRHGELVDGSARMVLGPEKGTLGLMSRRSELVSIRKEIGRLDSTIAKRQKAVEQSQQQLDRQEHENAQLRKTGEVTHQQLTEHRVRGESLLDRVEGLTSQLDLVQAELGDVERTAHEARRTLVRDQQEDDLLCGHIARLERLLERDERQLAELELRRADSDQVVTQAKVLAAKTEQRLEGLRAGLQQLTRDRRERVRAVTETRETLAACQARRTDTSRQILTATSEAAEMYLHQQSLHLRKNQLLAATAKQRHDRQEILGQLQAVRDELAQLQQDQHEQSLHAEKTRHERATLAERLADDYGIALAALEEVTTEELTERNRIDEEIADLRRKISNIGTVNMDALSELDDLEQRHGELAEQYADLVAAKNSLERIIHKINADSRRLFTETLEAIRANFQVMFRKVFGGGQADIVLEEGEDILKAGIDIVATPPGKQSLGLSLLSGGERALTVVTLLLAIFEYRPSPFCVLDEVDGPLDESNIGRFVDVLNEFLQWTKFVVVTHSKKTMTAAHTLYGITMQESGVSKRVSVRFEDVSEDGEIRQSAIDQSNSPPDRGAA